MESTSVPLDEDNQGKGGSKLSRVSDPIVFQVAYFQNPYPDGIEHLEGRS